LIIETLGTLPEPRRILHRRLVVELLLDRDGQIALIRRGHHRVGAGRLLAALVVLEEGRVALDRGELVRVDADVLPGLVVARVVTRVEHERHRVGGLLDDVGDDDRNVLDTLPGLGHGE